MIRWRIDKRHYIVKRLREGYMDILEYKIQNDLHGFYWDDLLTERESESYCKLINHWSRKSLDWE